MRKIKQSNGAVNELDEATHKKGYNPENSFLRRKQMS